MSLSKFSFIIPEKKTAKGRSVSQKEYEAKKKLNFIAKWTFEFPGLFQDKAADEMFCKTCSGAYLLRPTWPVLGQVILFLQTSKN